MEAVWETFSPNIKKQAVKTDGTTVTLMVYEYGMAIATAKDRDDFMKACVPPEETDRAGATAESFLREVVEALRQKWGNTFQASSVVWRMWANHETRNLNRSTWNANIANPPPSYLTNLLDPAESRFEEHLNGVAQSSSVALDCVRASIGDCQQLRRYLESAGRYLDDQEQRLVAREAIIEGIIRNLVPPSPSTIIDPMPLIENIEDTEHAE
ncbi:hypothetical protein PInf_002476 [Phytophthora infestans]|nr:hypothetical protein PInf_002476 [Phytophthora infestans]